MALDLDVKVTGIPKLLDPIERDETPGYFDTLGAAFRLENISLNAAQWMQRQFAFGETLVERNSYNAFEGNDGTIFDRYPDALIGVASPEEKESVRQRLHREEKDLESIQMAGGHGVLSMLTAGILDPLMLVPVGGAANTARVAAVGAKGVKVLPSMLKGGTLTAAAGMGFMSAGELILHANQERRTRGESALNIASATVLAGILGGAVTGLSTKLQKSFLKDIEHDFAGVAGGSNTRVPLEEILEDAANGTHNAEIRIAKGFKIPEMLGALRTSPVLEVLTRSRSQAVKRAALNLSDQPVIVEGFEGADAIESIVRQSNWRKEQITQVERQLYAKYKARVKASGETQLSLQEFRENAGASQRLGQASGFTDQGRVIIEPEAAELATFVDELVYKRIAIDAVDAGLLPEEVVAKGPKFAKGYLSRRYLRDKILNDRDAAGNMRFQTRAKVWLRQELTDDEKAKAIKARPGLTEEEAIEEAIDQASESIVDTITGMAPGQGLTDRISFGDASPLRPRALTWDDEFVLDFLDNDLHARTEQYIRSMVPRIELQRRFGDTKMTDTFQEIRKDYKELFAKTTSAKQRAKLIERQKRDEQIIKALRDRLLGTYAVNNKYQGLKSIARIARSMNLLAQGGQFMISSIPDVGMSVIRNGLIRTVGSLASAAFDPKAFRMAARELKMSGAASEMALNTRMLEVMDLGSDASVVAAGRTETFVKGVAGGFGKVSMLTPWNHWWKQFAGVTFQTRLISVIDDIAMGRRVSKRDLRDLSQVRISEGMARRMARQLQDPNGSKSQGGISWAETRNWTDDEARRTFRSALGQMIDNTILTPGIGDRPLFMSEEWGKTMFQYKTFALSATSRLMATAAQQLRAGDMAAVNGLLIMISAGALVEQIKRAIAGREQETDPVKMFLAGLDRSGSIGIMGEPFNIASKLGFGIVDGGPLSSRYAARNVLSSMLGPTAGLVESGLRLTSATREGFSEGDVHAARKLIPYQNIFYWRFLFDKMEEAFNDAAGIPKTRRKKR
jgi:hypothetical protein